MDNIANTGHWKKNIKTWAKLRCPEHNMRLCVSPCVHQTHILRLSDITLEEA